MEMKNEVQGGKATKDVLILLPIFFFYDLRWLKTVSSTFQDVDFDVSLLPLVIT